MYTQNELIWLAGFLDGDGCFTCSGNGSGFIRVAHTHKPTLDFLVNTFGGSLHNHNHSRPAHYKQTWRWMICGDNAKNLAVNLLPFLREKQPQAELLIDILDLRTGRGVKPSTEHKNLKKALIQKLKELKHANKQNVGTLN